MTISCEDQGTVRTIIHDRYHARNAMDPDSADALYAAFLDFEANPDLAVAVLWGAGGAFCAGWDLKFAGTLAAWRSRCGAISGSWPATLTWVCTAAAGAFR